MAKVIDLNKTVAELVGEYPEIKEIMKELGFTEIVNPMALKVMGKVMTIPKGAMVKGIDLDTIRAKFRENGFVFADEQESGENGQEDRTHAEEKSASGGQGQTPEKDPDTSTPEAREELLKSYIQRLSEGEDLESVRAEFVKNFETVSVHEIAGAEQKLIGEGMPVKEVQKLCDIHSALFHGRTEAEVWMDEEAGDKDSAGRGSDLTGETEQKAREAKKAGIDASYIASLDEGHPVRQLIAENKELSKILRSLEQQVSDLRNVAEEGKPVTGEAFDRLKVSLASLMKLKQLYSRKEELLMPRLDNYGITGPTKVMWGVDDEIRSEIRALLKLIRTENIANYLDRIQAVAVRAEEMIYKEENILFPLALENFTQEEWLEIYRDLPEMGEAFVKHPVKWEKGEAFLKEEKEKRRKAMQDADQSSGLSNGKIYLDGGELTVSQLQAVFAKLPVDITFIDEKDINRFFASENHIFARPKSALGREVYSCHPQAILPIVQQMIADFKAHKRESVERWIPKPGNPVRIQYFAVYDDDGAYIGTVEIAQQFGDVLQHIEKMHKVDGTN